MLAAARLRQGLLRGLQRALPPGLVVVEVLEEGRVLLGLEGLQQMRLWDACSRKRITFQPWVHGCNRAIVVGEH